MGSLLLHEGKTDTVGLVARDGRHNDIGLGVVVDIPADWCTDAGTKEGGEHSVAQMPRPECVSFQH